MKRILVILSFCLVLCACGNSSDNKDLESVMAEKEYIIVDVRTKEEYEDSHVVGAINIPYNDIDKDVNLDKDKNIFVYCKSGNRSKIAFNELSELGYTVYDLGAFEDIDLSKE